MGEELLDIPAASSPCFFSRLHSEQYKCSRFLRQKTGCNLYIYQQGKGRGAAVDDPAHIHIQHLLCSLGLSRPSLRLVRCGSVAAASPCRRLEGSKPDRSRWTRERSSDRELWAGE